jgi:RNA polymerase sigma factor (TIGR02999 family)
MAGGPEEQGQSRADWNTEVSAGVQTLADELLPVFYEDLRRLARRERHRAHGGLTLQTTALVNEAYLRLRSARGWNDDTHFLRAAALAMRHALLNHAEARVAEKRGSGVEHLPLTAGLDVAADTDETVLAIDEALARLAQHSLRLAQVVECRYFAGFGERETARALDLSERTVRRDWDLARAWLHRELSKGAS